MDCNRKLAGVGRAVIVITELLLQCWERDRGNKVIQGRDI